jgi:hypothetical protein
MDVAATILPLLNCADIANEVVKYRVTLALSTQPVKIIEYLLDSQPDLDLLEVIQVDPNDQSPRLTSKHRV